MVVVSSPDALPRHPHGLCLALGMFDGVHLGHQHVLHAALTDAATLATQSVVLTFDPHPLSVVRPERAPRLLQTLPQRLRAFARLGLEAALVVPFTPEIAALDGEAFIRGLLRGTGPLRSLSVGEDFLFGHARSGNVALLRRLGAELDFTVHAAPPVSVGGEVVSSSRIRECLRAGQWEHVAELLGRPYALAGVVQRGDQLGRQLGFPTANLDVAGLALPPAGVYATRVRRLAAGTEHPAVLNLGVRPTLARADGELRFEVHLLDFAGDLYGEELEVTFVRHLRAEQRFSGLDALRAQITADASKARALLGA
jgi:riboflavin kinase/FMN adenylyltransferase